MSEGDALRPVVTGALEPRGQGALLDEALRIAISVYQALAVAVLVGGALLAISWLKRPFIGALLDETLTSTRAGPTVDAAGWDLYRQGIQAGDRLVSLNALPVQYSGDVQAILKGFRAGEGIPAQIEGFDGTKRTLKITLASFPAQDGLAYAGFPIVIGFFYLVLGAWVGRARPNDKEARVFGVLAAFIGITLGCFFDSLTTHALAPLWILGLAISAASLVDLGILFPSGSAIVDMRRYLRWIGYLLALALIAYAYSSMALGAVQVGGGLGWQLTYAFVGLAVMAYMLLNAYRAFRSQSSVNQAQARIALAGAVLSAAPITLWLLASPQRAPTFSPIWLAPMAVFPVAVAYALLGRRSAPGASWWREGAVYLSLSVAIIGAYALLITGLTLILGTARMTSTPLWAGALTLLLALVFNPLQTRLRDLIDRTFFVGERAYADAARQLAQDLTRASDLADVGRLLQHLIATTLASDPIHIFVYDALDDQFAALPGNGNRPSTDIRFQAGGALPTFLTDTHLPLDLTGNAFPPALQTDRARLALLGSSLFIRLAGRGRLGGWLAVGPRPSRKLYSPRDLGFLQNIADQTSAAVQRLQAAADLGRRVREMNSLSRIAQGANTTLAFADVLELIYTQTSQIIPLSDFHITLYDKDRDHFHVVFAVENHERLPEREQQALSGESGLAPAVVRSSRPIRTQDYARECRARGTLPAEQDVTAWLGVPMNAGAASIGALSIASRDPSAAYTTGHLALLQTIADQAAGAIVKANLLQELQERARQLSKLNDVTRQFASTLQMERLLKNIVEGASRLMGCEACVLYLADQPTKELVIQAAAGPFSGDPVGRHLAAGSGMAGRAASTGDVVIENRVSTDADDDLGLAGLGFTRRACMAAPLQAQDKNLGVLLVMNRRDGLPFAEQDQTLLTAIAGQAAVATENVRLYMLTDQELAARVEELSVMQRIDRELNASLDVQRAMRITLDWALRHTNTEAGLIGMVEGERLQVVAQAGYGQALGTATAPVLPLTRPGFQAAVDSALPQQVDFATAGAGGLLPGSDHHTVVPIRREAAVIGLLVLEGTGGAHEDLAFLSRLSDHAAIAIANAQLYDQVQRANVSKSEFISLVAHELKSPMTSIKGYAELLAAGTVGPITEMQASFLNTIRANTERMSTLVSDLNDNSKIEAGQLRLEFKAVGLGELIDESLRSSQHQIDEKKQTVQVELPADLPRVWGDETRLGQVLTNLISNANKYTPEGGSLSIGAEASPNRWDAEGPAQVVHVWLRDNGIGISQSDQQQVFQKFFRSDDPKAREVPGAGLGLNITRSLVDMQGGRIWFESQFRLGTTFHFTVPVAES